MGSSDGDNYCSQIYRVLVKYFRKNQKNLEEISVIIKSMPITEHNSFLDDMEAFLKEKITYFNILPRMEILLANVRFGAKCFYAVTEPISTMVFEDLKDLGYEMGKREEGLDFNHASFLLKKIGKFHATSMILAKKDPIIMENFQFGLFNPNVIQNSQIFQKFFLGSLESLIEVTAKWPGYEIIVEKMQIINKNFIEILKIHSKPRKNQISVLNHGDLWVNNIMFKYGKDNQLDDVIFVDFQMSFFSSLGVDLNYFFNTSLNFEVLKFRIDELLKVYYSSLRNCLEDFQWKFPLPSFDDILNEYRRNSFYGFAALFGIFPYISMDKNNSNGMTVEKMADEEFGKIKRKMVFSTKRVQDVLKFSLKRFDDLGVFNVT